MTVSINFSGNDGNLIVPGGNSSTSSQRATSSRAGEEDDGIIITPSPSSIVIKTRLMKGTKQGQLTFENDNDDAYVPPSIADICNDGNAASSTANNETKVFLNICSHQLIAKPCQRKALDEDTGKEIDGWRLPMAMGELRPCYDKSNNAAIVADCILAPEVVEEMKSDSNHLHFICDLVIQAASRKFGRTVFGGRELDKRYKLPRMKYVGYVDEVTGLPINSIHEYSTPPPQSSLLCHEPYDGPTTIQKASVAKQRVKGHGGKKTLIIEEMDSNPTKSVVRVTEKSLTSPLKKLSSLLVDESAHSKEVSHFRIELLMAAGDGRKDCRMPLFDFLRLVTTQEDGFPPSQHQLTSSSLREMIRNPNVKQSCDNNDTEKEDHVHKSQLLKAPIPYGFTNDTTELLQSAGFDVVDDQRSWTLIAKVSSISSEMANLPIISTTVVDLSTFLLRVVSTTGDAKTTDCVLPFPVDTRHSLITTSFNSCQNNVDEVMEIRMPLLHSALYPNHGPDPGTPQFEILHALSSGVDKIFFDKGAVDGRPVIDSSTTVKEVATKDEIQSDSYNIRDVNAKAMMGQVVDKEDSRDDVDETQHQHQKLPEDAFHSQDILSRHYLQQQQDNIEMRRSMATNKDNICRDADEANVEYINVDDFRIKPPVAPRMLNGGGTDSSAGSGGSSCVTTVNNDLILGLV
jgi:hypothetical protein